MKLKVIIFLFAMLFIVNAQSQYYSQIYNKATTGRSPLGKNYQSLPEDISGSRYLSKTFSLGFITTIEGKRYLIENINIDLADKEFIIKTSKDSIFIFDKLKGVEINKRKYIKANNKILNIIFENKEFTLYKDFSKTILEKIIDKRTNTVIRESKWGESNDLYYQKKDGELIKLIRKKKNVLALFDNSVQTKLKKYIKTNNLNLKKEKNILRIFRYYGTLFLQ